MKATITIFGIVVALGGTFCGFLDWYLANFYLDTVDWEGPMVTVQQCSWLLNTMGVGFGVVLIGIGGILRRSEPSGFSRTEGPA